MQRKIILGCGIFVAAFVVIAGIVKYARNTTAISLDTHVNSAANCTSHRLSRAYDGIRQETVEYEIQCICDIVIAGREYHREFDDTKKFEYKYSESGANQYLESEMFDCGEYCNARCAETAEELK